MISFAGMLDNDLSSQTTFVSAFLAWCLFHSVLNIIKNVIKESFNPSWSHDRRLTGYQMRTTDKAVRLVSRNLYIWIKTNLFAFLFQQTGWISSLLKNIPTLLEPVNNYVIIWLLLVSTIVFTDTVTDTVYRYNCYSTFHHHILLIKK